MTKENLVRAIIAGLFSTFTIGILTLLTYKTELGVFIIAHSDLQWFFYMDIQKVHLHNQKIFFGHLLTSCVGVIFLYFLPLPIFVIIPLAVGIGVTLMIALNVTHPPAGGNPIIVIIGSVSLDYLINPVILGSIIILVFGIILNRLILKEISSINGYKIYNFKN